MTDISTELKSTGRRMRIFGLITMLLGVAAICSPLMSGLSIVLSVGLLVMAGGIMRMIWAFGEGSFGKGVLAFALGALTLLCGLALVSDPLVASGFLTILIAIFLFADGVAEIIGALRVPSGRLWLLVGGIVSILLAIMIWRQYPLSGVWAIGVILGVKLLFVGIVMIAGGSAVRTIGKAAIA